jgi:hypothetical protein
VPSGSSCRWSLIRTCGYVVKISTGNQRVAPAQGVRISSDREVDRPCRGGALHQSMLRHLRQFSCDT